MKAMVQEEALHNTLFGWKMAVYGSVEAIKRQLREDVGTGEALEMTEELAEPGYAGDPQ